MARGEGDEDLDFVMLPRLSLPSINPSPPAPQTPGGPCQCDAPSPPPTPPIVPECNCPRNEQEIVIHEEYCLLWKNETFNNEPVERICICPPDMCTCKKAGREVFDEWRRKNRSQENQLSTVLEPTHPLMQKFQETLRRFLLKENERAEQEIIALRDELRVGKKAYDADLEAIYRQDHDTNAQRALILEYEETLANERKVREEAEERARTLNEQYKACKEKLDADMGNEQDARQELDALQSLVLQLEKWREETESDLATNQNISEKMRQEKKAKADEKRKLDIIILSLNNEIWRLESKMELYKKQMEIKAVELEAVTDRSTAYVTELEDLEIDQKRLMGLWNSVVMNIKQRDRVFDSVREDYMTLQENYRTVANTLDITKKSLQLEMDKSKDYAMQRDKLVLEVNQTAKLFEYEDQRRQELEKAMEDISNAITMSEQDEGLIKSENQTMQNILKSTQVECDHRADQKRKLENEILENLQDCLLNDKAVGSMAQGIKKMRDMSRKLEISLMAMENQHAKLMFDIEVYRDRHARNNQVLEKNLAKVKEKEKEINKMQDQYDQNDMLLMKKQRELGHIQKKFNALKEIYDMKSPQELRIEQLELHIRHMREKTEKMQHEWLRLQGHVVRLTAQHQKLVSDIGLINKQVQICRQKIMSTRAEIEKVNEDRQRVERALQDHHSRLEVLVKTRKECRESNENTQRLNVALTYEYTCNLKGAEDELFELEDQIEALEKEKVDLTQDLDRAQREALAWQRKGALAVELKRNIKESQSAAGEIGQMKNEIHRMEVRREQLRKTGEKLAEDLAQYVTRRENLLEKTRAIAAVEENRGTTGSIQQTTYKHKLRLAKSNLARSTKDLADAKVTLKELQTEQNNLEKQIAQMNEANAQLEETVASLLKEARHLERDKQYLLERVVRNQRLGKELQRAVKRQSVRTKKPKQQVIDDFKRSYSLNDCLKRIVDSLSKEYPYLEDKLEVISNTLNIETPSGSPRLTDFASCHDWTGYEEGTCVIPEGSEPDMPYWQKQEGTCVCDENTCE